MDTDRQIELRRQRALVAEHLAWLDRQIAAENPGSASPVAPSPEVKTVAAVAESVTQSPLDADTIITRYAEAPDESVHSAKRGCLIVFFAVFIPTLITVVISLWLILKPQPEDPTITAPPSQSSPR